ncbi:MAG: hypothetical protein ACOYOZ_11290, partial [Pirellula sp.]
QQAVEQGHNSSNHKMNAGLESGSREQRATDYRAMIDRIGSRRNRSVWTRQSKCSTEVRTNWTPE